MTEYIIAILAIIIAVILIRKVVSCMFRIAITLVLMAILAYLYFTYL